MVFHVQDISGVSEKCFTSSVCAGVSENMESLETETAELKNVNHHFLTFKCLHIQITD